MTPILKVRVTSVDHYGFNGRDNHPTDADINTVLTVERMEVEGADQFDDDGASLAYTVWFCKRADGSEVEMIDFEIEPVPLCDHEWQEQPGEPAVDVCTSCGERRY